MSRKTSRNAFKNGPEKSLEPSGAVRAITSNVGFSGLALGSIAFSVGGVLHAQNAPQGQDQNSVVPNSTTGAQQLQEIVVTGIRGSLQRSLDIKKESLGVVDSISAESIGHFPSSSLGDALEHVPGVTVQGGVSDFHDTQVLSNGNASAITIDGLGGDFVETLLDGRPQATVEYQSRQFDFASLGADFVGEVDVHKSPDFSLSSGAAGGTVNIKLPKPFDHPGFQAHALGSGSLSQLDGQATPDAGALISDTFDDNRFGVLIEGEYNDQKSLSHQLDTQGWEGTYLNTCQYAGGPACVTAAGTPIAPGASVSDAATPVSAKPAWYIQNYSLFVNRTDDRSKNGRAAFQWHPVDAMLITLDGDYSDDRVLADRAHFSNWFSSSQFYNVQTDGNGTITNFDYGPAPTDLQADVDGSYVKNMDYGLNVLWDLNDAWTAEFDADQSASYLNPDGQLEQVDADVGYGPSIPGGTNGYVGGIAVPGGNSLPYQTAPGPNSDGANFLGLDPYVLGSHVMVLQQPIYTDLVNQAKLDATWEEGSTKVNFGVQFVENTLNTRTYDDQTNNAWQLFAGYGPLSGNAPNAGVALPPSLFSGGISTANFLPGWSGNGNLAPAIPLFNPFSVINYLGSLGPAAANPNTIPASYTQYTGGFFPLALRPSSVLYSQEKTYSPYISAVHEFDVDDMPLNVRVGLRYDRTSADIGGLGQQLQSLTVESADHSDFQFNYANNNAVEPVTATNNYNYLLPALDLNLLVRPDLKLRFDASRTATKPPLADLEPTVSVNGRVGALTATGGNPQLLPLLSDNFTLGAEWYYGGNDYLAVEGYFKRVSQFAQLETFTTTINGVIDPTTGKVAQFADTTYVNGPSANVHGVEITWQQMLPFNFGYTVNGNIIGTNKPYDPYIYTNQFALPGIGDSVNVVGFYEARGFQARVSFNWQASEFLLFGQTQNNSSTGTEPTFLEASKTVDFTTSYDINKNVNVFFEALNLTDAQYVTRGRFESQILDIIDYGRSFTLGARLNF
ncbi:MAG: TonB-dependent receptor [Steroidobacteraceae bacterium]